MDKKAVVRIQMEYYSAIKKNTFESILMRWMKLEPIIHTHTHTHARVCFSLLVLSAGSFSLLVLSAGRNPGRENSQTM